MQNEINETCSNNPAHSVNLNGYNLVKRLGHTALRGYIILLSDSGTIMHVKLFQLEAHLLASQNEVVNLKKDILHLKEQLQKKDNEILELSMEIDILKEELILRFS